VVTLPTLGQSSSEPWGITLGRGWKVGRAGKDDGILIVVAPNDRQVRIEVGYGLEGDIPDARAHRIVTEVLLPAFRGGNFARGLGDSVDVLERLITNPDGPEPSRSPGGDLYVILIFVGGIFVMMAVMVRAFSVAGESTRVTSNRPDDDDDRLYWGRSSDDSFSSSSSSGSSFSGGGGSFGGGGASGKW
jgi:uncharacterized protein